MSTAAMSVNVDSKARQEAQHMMVHEKGIQPLYKRCSQAQPVLLARKMVVEEMMNTDAEQDILHV